MILRQRVLVHGQNGFLQRAGTGEISGYAQRVGQIRASLLQIGVVAWQHPLAKAQRRTPSFSARGQLAQLPRPEAQHPKGLRNRFAVLGAGCSPKLRHELREQTAGRVQLTLPVQAFQLFGAGAAGFAGDLGLRCRKDVQLDVSELARRARSHPELQGVPGIHRQLREGRRASIPALIVDHDASVGGIHDAQQQIQVRPRPDEQAAGELDVAVDGDRRTSALDPQGGVVGQLELEDAVVGRRGGRLRWGQKWRHKAEVRKHEPSLSGVSGRAPRAAALHAGAPVGPGGAPGGNDLHRHALGATPGGAPGTLGGHSSLS